MLKIILFLTPLIFLILNTLFTPLLAPFDALESHSNHLHQAPNLTYYLGADSLNGDVFSRLFFTLRISLFIGICSSFLSIFFTLFYLFLAGCFFYTFWMRILDLFLALPAFLLMIFFQSFVGVNIFLMIFLIALVYWPFIARIVEGELKRLENLDFYKVSIVLGRTKFRALFKDLLPTLKSLVLVLSIFNIIHVIAAEATLNFLGLGLGFNIPTLGTLLNESPKVISIGAWWTILFLLLALMSLFLPLLWLGNCSQKVGGVGSWR